MARDAILKLRLNSQLKAVLKGRAAAHDQSISDYVRQLILRSIEDRTILDELDRLTPAAGAVGASPALSQALAEAKRKLAAPDAVSATQR